MEPLALITGCFFSLCQPPLSNTPLTLSPSLSHAHTLSLSHTHTHTHTHTRARTHARTLTHLKLQCLDEIRGMCGAVLGSWLPRTPNLAVTPPQESERTTGGPVTEGGGRGGRGKAGREQERGRVHTL